MDAALIATLSIWQVCELSNSVVLKLLPRDYLQGFGVCTVMPSESAFNPMTTDDDDRLARARAQWRWRGKGRPPFADVPAQGQVSVWDFPRPPELLRDSREIVVRWGGIEVARTHRAWAVRETAHPPTLYLPLADIQRAILHPAGGGSFCEWKGPATYWDLVDGVNRLEQVAWSYPQPLAGAEPLAACIAFYAHDLNCSVDGAKVVPQSGGFYGGWITPDLAGPFKGDPGSDGW
jgi:uncharacterized protein (DUF427 family)